MRHQCKYFLIDGEGVRRCTQCGQPAQAKGIIETKQAPNPAESDKAGVISDLALAAISPSCGTIFPAESQRLKVVATSGHQGGKTKVKKHGK